MKRSLVAYVLIALIASTFIASLLISKSGTYGYFTDSETIPNNTITTGVWAISGEIVDFVVPKRVILDEVAEFTVLFKNTGDVSLAARAFVEVRKGKKGKIIATENGALVEVGVGETVYLTVSWDTSDAKPGRYRGDSLGVL